jgi:hypothetical protein
MTGYTALVHVALKALDVEDPLLSIIMGDHKKTVDSEMLSFVSSPPAPPKPVDAMEEVDSIHSYSRRESQTIDVSDACIAVSEPSLVEDRVGKHVEYVIRVRRTQGQDSLGNFETIRRYSDFLSLRKRLVDCWPGVIVPPIPPKQIRVILMQGKLNPEFIETRRHQLDFFLKQVMQTSYLYQTQETQKFLRSPRPFEAELSTLQIPSASEISRIYEDLFSEFNYEASSDQLVMIENTQSFCLRHAEVLKRAKKSIKLIVEAFGHFSKDYWTMLDNLQDFETTCVSEYFGRTYSALLNHTKRKAYINPFEVLLSGARQELLDIESLIEAISTRSTIVSSLDRLYGKLESSRKSLAKLQAGKKTFKALFTSKPSVQMIAETEAAITQTEEEVYKVEALLRLITARMGKAEIPQFNENRLGKYKRMIQFFARSGIQEFDEVSRVARQIYLDEVS